MRKWWMHREIKAMREAVAGDREVALELEHPGMEIRLEKGLVGSDRLGVVFFLFTICALGLMRIVVVDE